MRATEFFFIAGVDEAGRGPLAGPVTAAAVCLPAGYRNPAINDSKQLTESQREELFDEIATQALAYAIHFIGPREIERRNILEASRRAMWLSAKKVSASLEARFGPSSLHFMVDGINGLRKPFYSDAFIKGDGRLQCISAASILAKVARDREMVKLAKRYPGYGLEKHKGYGTAYHRERIAELGPCVIHRRTFAGVKEYLDTDLFTRIDLR